MGPGLEQRRGLGLESVPRLAACGRAFWSGRLGTLGPAADLGAPAASATDVGTRGPGDLEPYGQSVGILEQQHLDSDLIRRHRLTTGPAV
jgi:hypothetical protein